MLQNVYSLPDLIDLALTVPEPGFVNFNIIHTVLHTIVKELDLADIRPWCHIENPLLRKTELTKSKLKEEARKRVRLQSFADEKTEPSPALTRSKSEKIISPATEEKESTVSLTDEQHATKEADDEIREKLEPESDVKPSSVDKESQTFLDTVSDTDETQTEEMKQPSTTTERDLTIQEEVGNIEIEKDTLPSADITKDKKDRELEDRFIFEVKEDTTPESGKKPQRAGDAWRYTNLNMRVEAAEEGLHRLSNIVDILADKMRKADLRKKAGFSSEELEVLDERITELEEAMARFAADHDLLLELQKSLNDMLAEFEAIKALASQLKQMQIDISKKADKEETWEALALKGDLELVNSKVDQLEFETAIEELGEAIGLLGIKFTRKNDEWEDRAEEIWRGINSKMSRDIFEAAKVKIESRLTALMYGLRKLKKVIEDLLYPEASGVTRCILCRRPACISGQECIGIYDSPKRPHSDRSSEEDTDKLKKTLDDAKAKRQKLEAPPFSRSRDTIISVPYSSTSYISSVDEKPQCKEDPQMKLMPKFMDSESIASKKTSKIPKLPDIDKKDTSTKSAASPSIKMTKSKAKSQTQRAELYFTNKKLADFERNKDENLPSEKIKYTAVLELETSKNTKSGSSSARSSVSIVDMAPDPEKVLQSFSPARLMPDTSRRNILLSPTSQREQKLSISLSPLQFDTDSKKKSSSSNFPKKKK